MAWESTAGTWIRMQHAEDARAADKLYHDCLYWLAAKLFFRSLEAVDRLSSCRRIVTQFVRFADWDAIAEDLFFEMLSGLK